MTWVWWTIKKLAFNQFNHLRKFICSVIPCGRIRGSRNWGAGARPTRVAGHILPQKGFSLDELLCPIWQFYVERYGLMQGLDKNLGTLGVVGVAGPRNMSHPYQWSFRKTGTMNGIMGTLSSLLSPPSCPLPSPPLSTPPSPSLRSSPKYSQGVCGRCKLPQRALGRSPSRNRIWCILAIKSVICWQQF